MPDPSPTPPSARLSIITAREGRVAVILRRGPSKQVRMLRLDLKTGELQGGQWLSGRLNEARCALSPSGLLFVYFAQKYSTELGTFSAISRPPYFTALALWPDGSSYGGGGMFASERRVLLAYNAPPKELNGGEKIPDGFEVGGWSRIAKDTDEYEALQLIRRRGFTQVQMGVLERRDKVRGYVYDPPEICEKPNPLDPSRVLIRRMHGYFEQNGPPVVHEYAVRTEPDIRRDTKSQRMKAPSIEEFGRLDSADWGSDGSLLYGRQGVLHQRKLNYGALQDETLVADLSAQRFENITPPEWAKQWPR